MENKTLQPLVWLGNLLILSLLLYMIKSAVGIDLNPNCHTEQVIFGNCSSVNSETQLNNAIILKKID